MWPITSVGFLCSIAALALMRQGQRFSAVLPLLLPGFGIGAALLLELNGGIRLGIVALLSGEDAGTGPFDQHTKIGLLSRTALIFLPIAVALAATRRETPARVAAVIAGLCLAFGAVSLLLVPNADQLADSGLRHLTVSLGSGIAITGLSVAVLARLGEAGWTGALGAKSSGWKLFETIFPVVLITPVFVEVLKLLILSNELLSPVLTQILGAALNVGAIGLVLLWATAALVQQRSTLQELLTRAFDAAPVAITTPKGRIIHWSRGCEELYGWSAAEAVGMFKHDLLASRSADPSAALESGSYFADRSRALVERGRSGEAVRVIEQVRPMEGFGRTPILVLSMTDIGARLDAEAALRESEERLSLALSSHDVGIFEWRAGDRSITWSPGSEQRLGFQPGDLSSWARWRKLADKKDVAATVARLKCATEKRAERFSFKYRLLTPSGTRRVIDGSARCFYDAKGAAVRIVGVNIDVTTREEREAALHAREAQLHSILETVPDAMIVIDERGIIRSFSRTAEQMFGYSATDAVGMDVSALSPGDATAGLDASLKSYVETGQLGGERLLNAVNATGAEIPVELRVGEASVGSERLFTGFVRDISERLDAEDRLSTLQTDLAHTSRVTAMGEMAAGLAHELNQPLTAIVNYLGTASYVLKHVEQPAQAEEMVDAAMEQALRAGEIIRRLREFVAKRETERRRESIEPAVREAAELVLVGHQQSDLRILYDFDHKVTFMLADRVEVQQVLVNLLRNSIEAMKLFPKENKEIRLQTRALETQMIEFTVRDNGPGIPETVLSRMYQPFTSTKGGSGMGIGLSICRRIVQAHGGTLEAGNDRNGGACFRFTLPSIGDEELQA